MTISPLLSATCRLLRQFVPGCVHLLHDVVETELCLPVLQEEAARFDCHGAWLQPVHASQIFNVDVAALDDIDSLSRAVVSRPCLHVADLIDPVSGPIVDDADGMYMHRHMLGISRIMMVAGGEPTMIWQKRWTSGRAASTYISLPLRQLTSLTFGAARGVPKLTPGIRMRIVSARLPMHVHVVIYPATQQPRLKRCHCYASVSVACHKA